MSCPVPPPMHHPPRPDARLMHNRTQKGATRRHRTQRTSAPIADFQGLPRRYRTLPRWTSRVQIPSPAPKTPTPARSYATGVFVVMRTAMLMRVCCGRADRGITRLASSRTCAMRLLLVRGRLPSVSAIKVPIVPCASHQSHKTNTSAYPAVFPASRAGTELGHQRRGRQRAELSRVVFEGSNLSSTWARRWRRSRAGSFGPARCGIAGDTDRPPPTGSGPLGLV